MASKQILIEHLLCRRHDGGEATERRLCLCLPRRWETVERKVCWITKGTENIRVRERVSVVRGHQGGSAVAALPLRQAERAEAAPGANSQDVGNGQAPSRPGEAI